MKVRLGFTMALLLGAGLLGCAGEAQLQVGSVPPPAPQAAPAPADSDGDGIADPDDKCPQEKEDGLPPDPKDGCPNLDPDNDGIKGTAANPNPDKCPTEAETMNGFEDEDGCPDKKPMVQLVGQEIKINEQVNFKTNSAEIESSSNTLLENIANVIKGHPNLDLIEVSGHADKRGTAALNQNLTQRRAKAVVDALVKLGVDAKRLRAVGYGPYCPLDPADNDTAYDKNRRVQFHILMRDGKPTGVEWGGCEEAKTKGMKPAPLPKEPPAKATEPAKKPEPAKKEEPAKAPAAPPAPPAPPAPAGTGKK